MTEQQIPQNRSLATWLFNPFQYIADWQALLIGLVVIAVTAVIGFWGNTHFDGVLDTHLGAKAPLWFFLCEGLIDWLSLSVVLLIAGLIIRKTSFRAIDVFGTQALARLPMLLSALVLLPPANQCVRNQLLEMVQNPNQPPVFAPLDLLIFGISITVVLVMLVWMVALMYRAYTVACNVKKARAIVSFIVGLIIAEVISKLALYPLYLTIKL